MLGVGGEGPGVTMSCFSWDHPSFILSWLHSSSSAVTDEEQICASEPTQLLCDSQEYHVYHGFPSEMHLFR
jgi:hypothetical protein